MGQKGKMYNPYMLGKQIYFRHPVEQDVKGKWHEWFSDEEITKYMTDRFWPNSKEAQLIFYKSLFKNKDKLVLSIVNKSNDEHIGIISLSSINWVHSYADIALVLGEKEYRKGSIAVEAFSMMLKVAFIRLNLKNVKSAYNTLNKESEALHRLMKFNKVGVYKKLACIDGNDVDVIVEMLDRRSWIKRNT
tara:strand:+ start:4936 stop:5505 length:570 start_codon:yes stop_codon:yes gene_type:complete